MNIATMHTQPLTPPPTSPVQDEIEVLLEEAAQTNQNIAHNFMQNHDAFRHIGDNIRTLRQQVLTIIDSLTGWSMNHPYLIMGTRWYSIFCNTRLSCYNFNRCVSTNNT